MQELLELSDLQLARSFDAIEKYGGRDNDPMHKRFLTYRPHLCRLAWDAYSATICARDKGQISEKGVVQRPLDESVASNFLSIFERSPSTTLRRDDFAMGYMASTENWILAILNGSNE